ncbi:MAG TPA: nicotinate phosphoribosyltransferase [Burkholderiales bacterium]|nr:nicotinate phosphoribosyltransferase [Burkholderiales bacterium]
MEAPRHRDPGASALLTDLYQLTMLQTYYERGMTDTAVFELFFRRLPPKQRNFLLAAGLEQVVQFLEGLHFSADDLEWLAHQNHFTPKFIDQLARLRFTGDVDAMPEGTVLFANQPIIRIIAPLPEAQLVETRLMNLLHFQTMIASKAARAVIHAPDKLLVDFGLRRAHGAEAGLLAARATYLAGMAGTATVLAGKMYGVPIFGTMAHSFIQAHNSEMEAFENFARSHPDNITFLIDTYDTEAAARKVVQLAPTLARDGIKIRAVRLDSGDLAEHARKVRRIFDDGGLDEVKIFASGGIDEFALRDLLSAKRAPIDGFGIGSGMDTSYDVPTFDCAYKLQEYAGRARRKRSEGKATWPGRKQVYRHYGGDNRMSDDLLTLVGDMQPGEPLLNPVMRSGRRLPGLETLEQARNRARSQLARLPEALRALESAPAYAVTVSHALRALAEEVDREQAATALE